MSIKSTLQTVKSRLDALLLYANGVTGECDASIGDAILTLANGYGQGEEIYQSQYNVLYKKNNTYPSDFAPGNQKFYTNLIFAETFTFENLTGFGGPYTFVGNTNLKRVYFPKFVGKPGYYGEFLGCPNLEFIQFGSIGNPVNPSNRWETRTFNNDSITVEIYVTAETLDDLPENLTYNKPWGLSNSATIVFKNSTTGDILV